MSNGIAICPRCLKEYSTGIEVCPEDGRRLVITQSDDMDRAGHSIDGQLTLLGKLGVGGMGSVYRALQHSMEREVAVKILRKSLSSDTTLVRRFLQEAKGASHLNHPNIITLFDFGQSEEGELYITMELLHGQTLREMLAANGAIDAARTVAIMAQVCDALGAAHEQGIVHRDLKPDNIFIIEGAGQMGEFVKVLDFGIAKIMVGDDANNITQSGVICGTPAYMSPEQVLGHSVDARSDIYSAALVIYELLTGAPPFAANTPMAVMMAQVRQKAPTLTQMRADLILPHRLEAVIVRALSKRPENRPQSAAELKEQLIDAVNTVTGESTVKNLGHMDTLLAHPKPIRETTTREQGAIENFDQLTSTVSLEGLPPVPAEETTQPTLPDPPPVIEHTRSHTNIQLAQGSALPWLITLLTIVAAVAVISYQLGSKKHSGTAAPPVTPVTGTPTTPSTDAPTNSGVKPERSTVDESNDPPSAKPARVAPAPAPVDPKNQAEPMLSEPDNEPTTLVNTDPPGATVFAGETVLGRTPLNLKRPESSKTMQLTLRLAGHETSTFELTSGTRDTITVRLTKVRKRRARKKNPQGKDAPDFAR